MRNVVCCFIGSSVLTFSFPQFHKLLKNLASTSFSFSFQQSALCDCFYNFLHHRNRFYQDKSHKSSPRLPETAAWHTDQSCFSISSIQNSSRCTMSICAPVPIQTSYPSAVRNIPADAAEVRRECPNFFSHILRTVQACVLRDRSVLLPHRYWSGRKTP